MSHNPEMSIVVPVFNSALTIPELVFRVKAVLNIISVNYELILADDCSTDNSWQVIKEACAADKNIIGVKLTENKGQWCSTLAGMSITKGSFIVTIDDDLEYNPEDIKELYDVLKKNKHGVVFGIAENKYPLQGKSRFSVWRKKLLIRFWDTALTDSFKILSRDVVFKDNKFEPEILIDAYLEHTLSKQFWSYADVSFNKRHSGNSNYSLLRKIRLFLLYTKHYTKKPARIFRLLLVFFTLVATALLFLGNVLGFVFMILIALILILGLPIILGRKSPPYQFAEILNLTNH